MACSVKQYGNPYAKGLERRYTFRMEQVRFPKPEISAEAVEALRELKLVARADKADILLVAGGLKPATEQTMRYARAGSPYPLGDFNRAVQGLREVLDLFHLSHTFHRDETPDDIRVTFWIADRLEMCERLEETISWEDSKRIPERGKLLGLPKTAIEAFPSAVMNKQELPKEVRHTRGYKLMQFMPARDHWREELAALEERATFVEQIAPGLLDDEPLLKNEGKLA